MSAARLMTIWPLIGPTVGRVRNRTSATGASEWPLGASLEQLTLTRSEIDAACTGPQNAAPVLWASSQTAHAEDANAGDARCGNERSAVLQNIPHRLCNSVPTACARVDCAAQAAASNAELVLASCAGPQRHSRIKLAFRAVCAAEVHRAGARSEA